MSFVFCHELRPGVYDSGLAFLKIARPGVTISCSNPREARLFDSRAEGRLFKFKNELAKAWRLEPLEKFTAEAARKKISE